MARTCDALTPCANSIDLPCDLRSAILLTPECMSWRSHLFAFRRSFTMKERTRVAHRTGYSCGGGNREREKPRPRRTACTAARNAQVRSRERPGRTRRATNFETTKASSKSCFLLANGTLRLRGRAVRVHGMSCASQYVVLLAACLVLVSISVRSCAVWALHVRSRSDQRCK